MLLAQTLLHLCAQDSYEQYIKMLVEIIVVVMLIIPVIGYVKEGSFQSFDEYVKEYEGRISDGKPDFEALRDEAWLEYLNGEMNNEGGF